MYIWLLNLGSFVLGLIAWAVPIIYIIINNKIEVKRGFVFSVLSICICSISLCMQFFYTNHLIKIGDWSALMVTFPTVTFAATVLTTITLLLNSITLTVYYKKL